MTYDLGYVSQKERNVLSDHFIHLNINICSIRPIDSPAHFGDDR